LVAALPPVGESKYQKNDLVTQVYKLNLSNWANMHTSTLAQQASEQANSRLDKNKSQISQMVTAINTATDSINSVNRAVAALTPSSQASSSKTPQPNTRTIQHPSTHST
jgi:hypothetical protein